MSKYMLEKAAIEKAHLKKHPQNREIYDLGPRKIMLVDDNQDDLDDIKALILKHDNLKICACLNEVQAMKQFPRQEIDLVIMDINLGRMDGIRLAEILKNMAGGKGFPILFVSADKSFHLQVDNFIQRQKRVEFLTKPLHGPRLLDAIVHLCKAS